MVSVPRVAAAVLGAMAAIAGVHREAEACSVGSDCDSARFFLPGPGEMVPANAAAILWQPTGDTPNGPDPSLVVLTRLDPPPATAIPLSATSAGRRFLLAPEEPLVAGATYQIVDHNRCESEPERGGTEATFVTGPELPLPTTLGTVALSAPMVADTTVPDLSGWCSVDATAVTTRVAFTPDPAAVPWLPMLARELVVDGSVWRRDERLYHVCESSDDANRGLAAGYHQVQMRAQLGTPAVLEGDGSAEPLVLETPMADVYLECPGDGGCALASRRESASAALLLLAALMARAARRHRRR